MSENVVAFVPRPRRVPALACADVYFNNADGGLTIIVHDEVGGAHVFKYALQTLAAGFELDRWRAGWDDLRGTSTRAS